MFESTNFWVALGFVIFVGIAYKPVTKALFGMLDKHSEEIFKQIENARRLQEEAQHQLSEIQRQQRDANKEAEEIIAHAKAEAERIREEMMAKLDETLERREETAIAKLAQAEVRAAREVRDMAVDIAIDAARAVLAEKVDDDRVAGQVDRSIGALAQRLR